MRVLSKLDVEQLLQMADAIDNAYDVFLRVGTPEIHQPVRTVLRVPGKSAVFGVMPAHLGFGDTGRFGVKTVVVDPANSARGFETHMGLVTVFDPMTGAPVSVMDAGSVTALRTAAASAVATRALAATSSGEVAVLGAGVQARLHLKALAEVMEIHLATVWARSSASAHRLTEWATNEVPFPVVARASVREATATADVICTVTSAAEPLLRLADVRPGTHVNAVGACFPTSRELHADLVRAAQVVVDVEESARQEAGDLLLAAADGLPLPVVELGEVIRGETEGRRNPLEITVFESLGFAALDVAAGLLVHDRAMARGFGIEVAIS